MSGAKRSTRIDVRLYDAQAIDELVWPDDADHDRLRRYLVPMMHEGPRHFIDNADVDMLALKVDDRVLPVVVSRERPESACVCSPYSHYIAYAGEELGKLPDKTTVGVVRGALSFLGSVVSRLGLDRVVYVNSWLLITNPVIRLSTRQIAAITDCLTSAFPDRAIVFRNVDTVTRMPLFRTLLAGDYRMLASRKIHILDGTRCDVRRKRNVQKDFVLLRSTPYEAVTGDELTDADIARLTEVYRMLYLERHCTLNPQLNENFFRLAIRAGVFEVHAFKRDGRVDGFSANLLQGGVLTPPAIGYDIHMSRELGLYRLVFIVLIRDALERKLPVNLSGGASAFKHHRGALPTVEFDAVYDRHLDPHRRIPWTLLRLAFSRVTVGAFHA